MIHALTVPSHGAAPGHMPFTYKAGVPFTQLVEAAQILRVDADDPDLPRADTLWYHLTHEEDLRVRLFCRTLLWLGESATHRATWADVQAPPCLHAWAACDLEPAALRRTFAGQLDDVSAYTLTPAGVAELRRAA